MNGVNEVYLYCGAHTDQVEDYVARSRWATTHKSCPFTTVQFVRISDARSAGDILRDLDKRSLVDGDFILVNGDLVSSIKLDGVLAQHRKRREDSAANIMTMVLSSAGPEEHRTKTNGITPVFAIDSKNKRCLQYDEINPLQSEHYVMLDPAIPDELSTDFEVRADLVDAQIDICTPEVLALWSESFDYELPRKNFLHGVLKDWELNGKMIYAQVAEEGYAARASNLQMYDAISRDMLDGWTVPFVPYSNALPSQTYKLYDGATAMEDSTSLATDAIVERSVIARHSSIDSGSKIYGSFVGKHCNIGKNVILEDCYIWDDVTIEDGTRISQSIIADGVIVGKNCSISTGVLVSFGAQISENTTLSDAIAISKVKSSGEAATRDTKLLGANTNAAPYEDSEDEDLDEEDPSRLQKSLLYNLANANLSASSISTLTSDLMDDDEDEDGLLAADAVSSRSRLSSFASFASDESAGRNSSFHTDAVHGLVDALRDESGDFDSAKLEFMGLRLATDASDSMMRKAIATAFARRAAELVTPEYGSLEPSKAAEKALTARKGATKFVDEVGVGGGESEQIAFILAMQRSLAHVKGVEAPRAGIVLAALLQQLYALDILEEEGILGWWEDPKAVDGESLTLLKDKCKVLVEWLENAEEEDDDDGDSESE